MKKILYIFVMLIVLWKYTYADECSQSCKINDGPPPSLEAYFTSLENITNNIMKAANTQWSKDSAKQERNNVIASLNSILSFGNYFWSFDFKVSLPLTNEIPTVVKRDVKRLEHETEKLTQILIKLEKRHVWGIEVQDICSGVGNCPFDGDEWDLRYFTTEVIKNNSKITEFIQSSILDKGFLSKNYSYFLVPNTFVSEISQFYSKDTLAACSSCKGEFKARTSEKIQNIGKLSAGWRETVKDWIDAWKLLRGGSKNPQSVQRQEELLADYLWKNNINSEQGDIVIWNLKRYGSGGFSSSNSLISSERYAQTQIKNEIQTFPEALREKFEQDDDKKVPYEEITRVDLGLKETEDIVNSITLLYEEQLPSALVQDTVSQEILARLLRMHFRMLQSIDLLWGSIDGAEDVCDRQGTWLGKCRYE